jgi:adenosine kinase
VRILDDNPPRQSDQLLAVITSNPDEIALVVTGTLAIDLLARYPKPFSRFDGSRDLNISMQLDALESAFGGCAMNVCYTLRCFGARAFPVVRAGRDFTDGYAAHVARLGIDTRGILVDDTCAWSSRCIILSDAGGNQLTAFFAGASAPELAAARPHADAGALAREVGARFALVAPDVPATMLRHACSLSDAGVPAIADPGQGLSDFTAAEADALLRASRRAIFNEHEWRTLLSLLGASPSRLLERMQWVVVTRGAGGCELLTAASTLHVPAVPPAALVEHTGSGDAFRAGVLVALAAGCELATAARVGALAATYKLESAGCQNHWFTPADFAARYAAAWGTPCPPGVTGGASTGGSAGGANDGAGSR